MRTSLRVYRELRYQARKLLDQVQDAGYSTLRLDGDGEAAEIFRLSCLEQGVRVAASDGEALPIVQVDGLGFAIRWPTHQKHDDNTGYEVNRQT